MLAVASIISTPCCHVLGIVLASAAAIRCSSYQSLLGAVLTSAAAVCCSSCQRQSLLVADTTCVTESTGPVRATAPLWSCSSPAILACHASRPPTATCNYETNIRQRKTPQRHQTAHVRACQTACRPARGGCLCGMTDPTCDACMEFCKHNPAKLGHCKQGFANNPSSCR